MATTTKQPTGPSSAETLADAAHKIVLDRRLALERDPGSVRGLVIELDLDKRGRLVESSAYVKRALSVNAALGIRKDRAAP